MGRQPLELIVGQQPDPDAGGHFHPVTERFQRAGKGRHSLAHMHARLVAHLPMLARHPDSEPGFVLPFVRTFRVAWIQIDEIYVVEGSGLGFLVQVIPDEVAHKARPQRPVRQGQLPRCPEAGHAQGIGPQQGLGAGLQLCLPGRLCLNPHDGAARRLCSCSSALW
ncbi:hypothetical protein D3C71_1665720 [compost metagenome]